MSKKYKKLSFRQILLQTQLINPIQWLSISSFLNKVVAEIS